MSKSLADLAVEFWKLLNNYDRFIDVVPDIAKPRLAAQARFGKTRLATILQNEGMHLTVYDGHVFEPNLPVVAINDDEFASSDVLVISQTIEPTILQQLNVINVGKVYLAKSVSPRGL
ncbi:hypothetical protein CO731_05344 (plasmid) [Aminobacter sp. MSH1]|uniref:hypothetical protein n=1 Tax=Aminobacter sp. MSH1 TaxID=374606 RepID=UPI000D3A1CF8|nr:hypothetical protein [Aminobacter sp. MSH1]AWC25843.1 hypothetical protein CO731_05344 [Aminobacter sp. MSH1]